MDDIKKYPGMHPICAAVCMITDAAMRLPQAKENADNRQRFLMAIPLQQGQVFNLI